MTTDESPASRLTADDWNLITEVLDAARPDDHPGQEARIRELAAAVLRPATRQLCVSCDENPRDKWMDNGMCAMCNLSNTLAMQMPDDFDGDESQESILERGITEMAKVWENAKKLREQCEREEASVTRTKWYLWTQEIRNIMGWEERYNGIYVTYFYTPEKAE